MVVTCDEDENVNMFVCFGFVVSNSGTALFNGSGCFVLRLFHSQYTMYTMFQFCSKTISVSVQGIAYVVFTCTWDRGIIIIYFNVVN